MVETSLNRTNKFQPVISLLLYSIYNYYLHTIYCFLLYYLHLNILYLYLSCFIWNYLNGVFTNYTLYTDFYICIIYLNFLYLYIFMKLLLYSLSDGTHMSFMPVYMFLIPKPFLFCVNVCMMYVSRDSRENSTPELMKSPYKNDK